MNPQETETPNPIIDEIVTKDKKAFDLWSADLDKHRRLDIPKEALRYLLISHRILELAEDPRNVDVAIIQNLPDALDTLVIERKLNPISNSENLNEYYTTVKDLERQRASQRATSGRRISIPPKERTIPIPPDVDSFHASHMNLIARGIIGLNDYVINYISLSNITLPENLFVSNYSDREELRGKGVATSFYDRLRETAKSLGFRFITGMNLEEKARNFFIKRGRFFLEQIKERHRGKFAQRPDMKYITVDFLNDMDKGKYLMPLA